jgi:hypothetical protein
MERPVSAPGGVSARRNQILERPVLTHRCRAHAPHGSVAIIFIVFTGTLTLASLNDPYHYHLLTSSPLDPQTTLTAHTPKHVPILAGDSSATSSATATKRCASASSSTARADKLLFPRLVRRVQAVIEVPVKVEEEEEEADGEANRVDWPDSTVPQPTSTPTGGINGAVAGTGTGPGTGGRGGTGGSAKRHKSSASSHQRRRSIIGPPSDDEEERRSLVEGEEEPASEGEEEEEGDDGSGEYVDEEEVENVIVNGTPSAAAAATTTGGGQKAAFPMIPWGRKHIGHQPDEEDDELMMYAKVWHFLFPLSSLFVDAVRFTG